MPAMEYIGHFTRLAGDECRQLVREHCIGRVSWVSQQGLQVVPVTYAMRLDEVVFRVRPETIMGELAGPVSVCFEVDDVDESTATGWSVVIRGEARGSLRPEISDVTLPDPWSPGSHPLVVVVTPAAYSGRAVSAPTRGN